MTTQLPSTGPFCAWVIAREFYDGPMTGIGLRARDRTKIFFRSVAWDSEQWIRVFAISPVKEGTVDSLQHALTAVEQSKKPFWFPGPATNTTEIVSAWDAVLTDAYESSTWSLVQSHDLLDAANEVILPAELVPEVIRLVQQGSVKEVDGKPLLSTFLDQLRGAG